MDAVRGKPQSVPNAPKRHGEGREDKKRMSSILLTDEGLRREI